MTGAGEGSGPTSEPDPARLDDDEIAADLVVGEALQGGDDRLDERRGGELVWEACDDDARVRSKWKSEETLAKPRSALSNVRL